MLFTSFSFLLFFPIVCFIYYCIPNVRARIGFLLFASYYFYYNLNPWCTLILLFSTIITYIGSLLFGKQRTKTFKKSIIWGIIVANVLLLSYFKYTNFLVLSLLNIIPTGEDNFKGFDIILPIGISFYLFKAISYIADVYEGKIEAERDFISFALYISFFPQLLAGPIDRAEHMISQFKHKIPFDGSNVTAGLKMMLWGYFLKLVFADRAIIYVDAIYGNLQAHNGTSILLAAILYSFQIYCDFAGYSLLSIGVAKAMGYDVMQNFNRPYMAKSITEFWKRWHISLTKWLTDYIYIPLGGSRCSKLKTYRNILVTFLVSGLWHGASWNFVIWGCIHGFIQIIEKASGLAKKEVKSSWIKLSRILLTFIIATLAWMFFRLPSFSDAIYGIGKIFTSFGTPFMGRDATPALEFCALGLFFILCKDVLDELYPTRFKLFDNKNIIVRYASYISISILILAAGVFDDSQFIYMQF